MLPLNKINCFCHPPERCESSGYKNNNNTCVTTTGCYTAINLINETQHITSGCFSSDVFQMQLTCNVASNKYSSIFCCSDREFCNQIHFSDLKSRLRANLFLSNVSFNTQFLSNDQPGAYDFSKEAILILMISGFLFFSCLLLILLFLFFFNFKNSYKNRCHCKPLPHDDAMQCVDRDCNFGKFINKTYFMNHGLDILLSMRYSYQQKCCGKACVRSLLKLSQMDFSQSNYPNPQSLHLHDTSSYPQRSLEPAMISLTKAQLVSSISSGSGSGVPFLVQATVARQIYLQECIGKGRYGEVWRGVYRGENVAVKVFSSRDEASWARETHIYSSVLLRHENILGYYASDITSRYGCTQLWIVSHYHPYGSLYDFLQEHVVDTIAALRLAKTAASGLCYLHSCILGLQGKPAIAHRDIKSKNILVQANGTCTIGDLGLAVMQAPDSTEMDTGRPNHKVGTKRYMAPEILADESLEEFPESDEGILPHDFEISAYLQSKNHTNEASLVSGTLSFNFEELKAADVYAFGLVLWEIFRRCLIGDGEIYPAHLPYWDKVSADPSFAEMRQVVHIEGARPPISKRWLNSKVLSRCASLMQECWPGAPNVRLPILRIKKTLDETFSVAVKEVDNGIVLDPYRVLTGLHTPADSGMNSCSHDGAFQCISGTPYYHVASNGCVRSPREVLALGRIIRWSSMVKSTEEPLTSTSLEED